MPATKNPKAAITYTNKIIYETVIQQCCKNSERVIINLKEGKDWKKIGEEG